MSEHEDERGKTTGDDEERVVAALRAHGVPADAAQVAAASGVREATVRRILGKLVKQREAARAGGGKFTLRSTRRGG